MRLGAWVAFAGAVLVADAFFPGCWVKLGDWNGQANRQFRVRESSVPKWNAETVICGRRSGSEPFTLSRGVSGGRGNQSAARAWASWAVRAWWRNSLGKASNGASGMARTNSEIHSPLLFIVVLEPETTRIMRGARRAFFRKGRNLRRAGPWSAVLDFQMPLPLSCSSCLLRSTPRGSYHPVVGCHSGGRLMSPISQCAALNAGMSARQKERAQ